MSELTKLPVQSEGMLKVMLPKTAEASKETRITVKVA